MVREIQRTGNTFVVPWVGLGRVGCAVSVVECSRNYRISSTVYNRKTAIILKQSLSFIVVPGTAAYCTESLRLPARPVTAALLLRTVVKETRCIS